MLQDPLTLYKLIILYMINLASFPITAEMDIWVFDPTASATEIEKVEELIKAACPEMAIGFVK